MEMGSGSMCSLTESGGSSSPPNFSTESLNGLKFGQKIYFEDAGLGVPPKPGGGLASSHSSSSSSSAAASGSRGRGGGAVPAGQPPRCQVEGCKVDLSHVKAYYSRHKVCGMHSKSPKVVVNGLEQRFCQQCSRFHQLPEFDQGKRSCRRRLAGHNERRRKPQPGSILSTRYGRLSSSVFENSSRTGGFLMDFTMYPRLTGRDAWPTARSSERVPGNQTTASGKILPSTWQSNSGNPSPDVFLQGSAGGTGYAGPGFPPGECFTGIADPTCALSLLSNQPWGSRNRSSGLQESDLMNIEDAPVASSTAPLGLAADHYRSTSWGFKISEAGSSSSHETRPDLALGQISQHVNSQFSGEPELSQQSGRQYMELEHSRAFDSTHQMHWSL